MIVLSDDGPYRLGGRTWSSRSPAPLANPDLVIKAEPGVRPLIKFADDVSSSDHPLSSLLQFTGGHVTIEGLRFEMDAVLPEELVTAIRAEDTELLVRGCSFRRTSSAKAATSPRFRCGPSAPPAPAGNRPPAVFADSCHFDGGQTGILAEGPSMSCCATVRWGPDSHRSGSTTRRSSCAVFGELRLMHTSIMAGPAPVFRFDGTQVRVWVDDSVIAAPAGRTPATLVMIDNSRNLAWRGRSNSTQGSVSTWPMRGATTAWNRSPTLLAGAKLRPSCARPARW